MSEQEQGNTSPEPEHDETASPRIWIGSMADYNNGTLHGDWVDAAVSDEDLVDVARAIVASSEAPGAEEWAIFDHEGFGGLSVGQHETLEVVAAVARGIVEHGPAFTAWAELHNCEPDMLANFLDAYLGAYDSPARWAEEVCADLDVEAQVDRVLPAAVARYLNVDYAGMAQDAWISGDIQIVHRPGGGVWIFDGRI